MENENVKYPDFPLCKAFNREVYSFLLAHPEIKTVTLGRNWYDSDESIGRTVQLVRELISQGRKVILLGPLPIPGMNVETGWAVRQIQAGHAIDEIRVDGSPDVRQSAILDKLKSQLKSEIAGHKMYLMDPTQRLCDDTYCYIVRDGLANFRDVSHLTEDAERKFEPDFVEALRWIQASQ